MAFSSPPLPAGGVVRDLPGVRQDPAAVELQTIVEFADPVGHRHARQPEGFMGHAHFDPGLTVCSL